MYVCVAYVCIIAIEARRGCHISGAGVTDGYELQGGCWESNLGLVKNSQCS